MTAESALAQASETAVKAAFHGEGYDESHDLALLLDLKQLGIDLVDQHLAG